MPFNGSISSNVIGVSIMAAGDITFFHQFKLDLGNKIHDLDSDTWEVGFAGVEGNGTIGTLA